MRLRNYLKIFVLFFIFYKGYCDKHHHSNISLFNRNICKSLTGLGRLSRLCSTPVCASPFTRRLLYYGCSHKMRRNHNPYAVFVKDIMRKYVYVVNVVVIFIILNSL